MVEGKAFWGRDGDVRDVRVTEGGKGRWQVKSKCN